MIVGDVIAYLVTLFDAAVSVPVVDGPKPSAVNFDDFVLVGSTGEDDDGATIDLEPSPLGPGGWRAESGEVLCSAWSWYGGTDVAARRDAALSYVEACAAAVATDRRLGGLLAEPSAVVTDIRYQPRQPNEGATVRVLFSVSYRALVQ